MNKNSQDLVERELKKMFFLQIQWNKKDVLTIISRIRREEEFKNDEMMMIKSLKVD